MRTDLQQGAGHLLAQPTVTAFYTVTTLHAKPQQYLFS
jgi:hypothetical protein